MTAACIGARRPPNIGRNGILSQAQLLARKAAVRPTARASFRLAAEITTGRLRRPRPSIWPNGPSLLLAARCAGKAAKRPVAPLTNIVDTKSAVDKNGCRKAFDQSTATALGAMLSALPQYSTLQPHALTAASITRLRSFIRVVIRSCSSPPSDRQPPLHRDRIVDRLHRCAPLLRS